MDVVYNPSNNKLANRIVLPSTRIEPSIDEKTPMQLTQSLLPCAREDEQSASADICVEECYVYELGYN